jgi:hypothetical protein
MPPARKRRREDTITAGSDYRTEQPSDTSSATEPDNTYESDYDFYMDTSLESQAPVLSDNEQNEDDEDEIEDMDAMEINVDRVLIEPTEPVGAMPWARTDPALRNLNLCVIEGNNILSCLLCRESVVLLTLKDAPRHVRSHRDPKSRKPTFSEITKLLRKYEIHTENVCIRYHYEFRS